MPIAAVMVSGPTTAGMQKRLGQDQGCATMRPAGIGDNYRHHALVRVDGVGG